MKPEIIHILADRSEDLGMLAICIGVAILIAGFGIMLVILAIG